MLEKLARSDALGSRLFCEPNQGASSCRGSACPDGSSATLGDGLAEVCQRSQPSYDNPSADGTAGLASHKVHALVQGVVASSTSVSARPPNDGMS